MAREWSEEEQQLQEALHLDASLVNGDLDAWLQHYQASCEDFLQFASTHGSLKVSQRTLPQRLRLPAGLRRQLVVQDVQVSGRRREPDDKIYANNAKIRALVARGNTLLSFRRDGADVVCFPLQGMMKFTGGMGDDDDQDNGGDNVTWQRFFTRPSEEADHIVSTSKENGSAAHLSAIEVDGELVLIGGSKNSHLVLSWQHGEEDLRLYPASPWAVAKVIMQAFFDLFKEIGEERTRRFLTLLAHCHITAIFEMLDPHDQHVELLTNARPLVRFITFTAGWQGGDTRSVQENRLCMYPLHSVRVAESYGIPTIRCEVVPLSRDDPETRATQFEALQTAIRGDFGDEGKVLYFATEDNEVIGLLKKKTVWYIMLRALREKYKAYVAFLHRKRTGKPTHSPTLEAEKTRIDSQIEKRFRAIQKWIGFSDHYREQWTRLGLQGNAWVAQQLQAKKLDLDDLGRMFPVVWHRFLKDSGANDHIPFETSSSS